MSETLKIVIPMAGFGSRLRPHTWSRPKALLNIAGKTVLAHLLDLFKTLPDPQNAEFIFIIGYLGDQIEAYVKETYPHLKCHFVVQKEMRGQSEAIYLAREFLHGPMIMAFADTLMETEFSFLKDEPLDMIAWVKPVPDPRRFGVAEVNPAGRVTRLIEKPKTIENNLAVIGVYYFRDAEALVAAIEEQMRQNRSLNGEFFLADAINILLQRGASMRVNPVDVWLDAGTPDAMLETNQYLLDHGFDNSAQTRSDSGSAVVPPVFIHPSAHIEGSVIGPYASIGPGCQVVHSVVRNSILEDNAQVEDIVLEDSLLGRNTRIQGQAAHMNVGDQSWVKR